MRLAAAALVTTAAVFGQGNPKKLTERTFAIVHAESAESQRELAMIVKAEFGIADAVLYTVNRSLTIRATAAQIAGAEWLLGELDRPAATPDRRPFASAAYPVEYGEAVRVFYTGGARSAGEMIEAATAIRVATEVRWLYTYIATGALVIRGRPSEIETVEWMWRSLYATGAASEFRMKTGGRESVIRLYLFPRSTPFEDLRAATTLVRSIAGVRRIFDLAYEGKMVARGTPEQMAAAESLLAEITWPPLATAAISPPFHMEDPDGEGVFRVFRMPAKMAPARLQSLAAKVRDETGARRVFTYTPVRVIAVRGTEAQLALAERLIADAP